MGEMTIRNIDDALLVELREIAERQGTDASDLARDVLALWLRASPAEPLAPKRPLNEEEAARQETLLRELRDIRAMTLEPLRFDSTLMIREMRDADG